MEWESRERAKQLIAFDGMSYSDKNARPMDIDLAMDCNRGQVFILGEIKYLDKEVPVGQRWYMFNFVNAMRRAGLHALAMVLEHEIKDANEDVQAATCRVREYLTTETIKLGWAAPKRSYTCDEMIKDYLALIDPRQPF